MATLKAIPLRQMHRIHSIIDPGTQDPARSHFKEELG